MIRLISLAVWLLIFELAHSEPLAQLSNFQWKSRIIVLNNLENQTAALETLEFNQVNIQDRDIVWFVLAGEDTFSNYHGQLSPDFANKVRLQYSLSHNQVVLIGKDGGVKSSFDGINLNAIFSDIDGMPMRQNEMREKKQH